MIGQQRSIVRVVAIVAMVMVVLVWGAPVVETTIIPAIEVRS